ncbi:MAG: hypothetical protein NVSMB12_19780 [Acidimicrobiales bacterium]
MTATHVPGAVRPTGRLRRWAPWLVLLVVLVIALVAGASGGGRSSPDERGAHIDAEVRCPTCAGQSALVSDAPAAKAVRSFVAQQVAAGRSDGQIKGELRDRYGTDILLRPPATGIAGLVWFLPIAVGIAALGGLVLAFRRWHLAAVSAPEVTEADRLRVESARRDQR